MKKNRTKYTITIGLIGADSHVGVTHLTIMLANYLASKEKYKVAVVDLSEQNSLTVLKELYEECYQEKTLISQNMFQIHKVDYYCHATQRDIANILHMGYEYILLDFGRVCRDSYNYEILRCHKRILVGSCCEWQQATFQQAIEKQKISNDNGEWKFATFLGIKEIRCILERKYHICIHKVPYEEDPFCLSRSHFEPLKNMLQEE